MLIPLNFILRKNIKKEVMEQLQQGFRDSAPRAGSDRLHKSAKSFFLFQKKFKKKTFLSFDFVTS